MKFDAVTINVGTAGTRVQVSNTTQKVRWIKFSAKTGNSGITYVGVSDVAGARYLTSSTWMRPATTTRWT